MSLGLISEVDSVEDFNKPKEAELTDKELDEAVKYHKKPAKTFPSHP